MVEDYLSDREQEEALRAWWLENWRWLLSGLVLGLALLGGWRYWQYRQTDQDEQAAGVYRDLELAIQGNDAARVDPLVEELLDHYGSTPYADQARLLQASNQVQNGKLEQAANLLQAVANGSKDEGLARVARLRWARVLSEQAKYDDALKLLDPAQAGPFAALTHETRGDVLLARGDAGAARGEYVAALESADSAAGPAASRDSGQELLQLKLQELGAPPASPSTIVPGPGGIPGKASP